MFFILSKTLYYILMPLFWIFILLAYALLTNNKTRQRKAIGAAFILLFLFGNQYIVNELFLVWEKPPVPVSRVGKFNYAVVLTGITNTERSSVKDKVFFEKGADRLLHTVQLYKYGKVSKIIITGGSGNIFGTNEKEAVLLRKTFEDCGIPTKDIMIEDSSRNTRENALFTKQLIENNHLQGRFLLITSAFHMRRAEGCFDKVGIRFGSYPVDIYSTERKYTPANLLLPNEAALTKSAILIHEITGYIVYKLMGYC